MGGAIKLFQDRKANPPPPRDPRLPPKPKGQTVGSFKKGLRTLTDAIGEKLQGEGEGGRLPGTGWDSPAAAAVPCWLAVLLCCLVFASREAVVVVRPAVAALALAWGLVAAGFQVCVSCRALGDSMLSLFVPAGGALVMSQDSI